MAARTQSMYDRQISIFSPDGRLFQVEYVFKAVKSCGLTALAIRGKDCVVGVCQRKISNKLVDPSNVSSFYKITPQIGAIMLGVPADCRAMATRARDIANTFSYENGYNMPVHYLAEKVADQCQIYTQHAYMRLHAVMSIFFAIDDETGAQLYRVDPAGFVLGYKAVSIGTKEEEGSNALEKVVKNGIALERDAVIRQAISTLQTVVGNDFQPSDVEVVIVSTDNNKVTVLKHEEVEEHLNHIAELD
eukprot:GDKJ01023874.1.p1 GENE.GDKJ01023874.1~~GDKJ01023874.1.p1  ORF type:complete len:247 (+),score=60.94 GDKJ01023874.1:62-802(+)